MTDRPTPDSPAPAKISRTDKNNKSRDDFRSPFFSSIGQLSHAVHAYLGELGSGVNGIWNQFWFRPRRTDWLGILRILAGAMLLYTHAVWSLDFEGFLGIDRRLAADIAPLMNPTPWHWSHFDWFESNTALWCIHWLSLNIFFCFMIGWLMPWTGVLAVLLAISYAHRATGTLFGLDQMNVALAMYLTLGQSGNSFSVDAWWRKHRRQTRASADRGERANSEYSVLANIGTRLIQVQLCIIYLFAGTGKLQGDSWWDGQAMWGALASYQYQSIDMTWTYKFPEFLAVATHLSVAWEVSYLFLVWPRLTRPIVIGIAILVHLGIGLFLGMMTFGYIMIVANLAFVEWDGLFAKTEKLQE